MDTRLNGLIDQHSEMMKKNTTVTAACDQWEAEVKNRENEITVLTQDRDDLKLQLSVVKSRLNPQEDSEKLRKSV